MPPAQPVFQPLGNHHDRVAFSCGVEALDTYFQRYARQDVRSRAAAVWVLYDEASAHVAGYYTLGAFSIRPQAIPQEFLKKLPRYDPLPAILLGRLAVDSRYRVRRYGEMLLLDALRRSWEQSAIIGAVAVIVDAKDDTARTFYEHYDFTRVLDDEYRLYLSMKTIERMVQGDG
ncbi:MAG: GNAT family N-acetyltransferase [Chloroflexota bacterium]|nr:GNAT family N-acetyltransferase [Chloroflexota bacterium]